MIRKNLLKATLITTIIATLLTTTACGKKSANNSQTTETKATVSAETKSNAAKELTKTSLVTFDYTDEDGNTYSLEGKAVASESGDAVIEVTDASGNKVTFTGKAKTVDGKLSVSDIAVKDAGTLVKADGTEIKVSTGSTVADASESTEGGSSDIAASDDVKQEVENNQKEEAIIEAAREEVTKAEESVKADDSKSNDTIIADNNGGSENNNSSDNGGKPEDNNTSDDNNTPAPSPEPTPTEPEETPTEPSKPEETPTEPTLAPDEDKKEEKKAIRSCWPHLQLSNGYKGNQGELEEIGDYLFPQYIDGSLSEAEMKSLIMNGKLYDIYTWDEDGNQSDTIPEAKIASVEIRKFDRSTLSEYRELSFGDNNVVHRPGKDSGSYVLCDENGTPFEWYLFIITYNMP